MAQIIVGNNIVFANADSNMDLLTTNDTLVIRSVVNGNYISYQPGRTINSLTGIQKGKGYILTSKVVRDIPLFDLAGGGGGIITFS